MDPLALALLIAGLLLALGAGFAAGRLVRTGAAQARLEVAVADARRAQQDAEAAAEAFQRDVVERGQAELAAAREELRRRQGRLERRVAEAAEKQQKTRERLDALRVRLEARQAALERREALAAEAADALEALTAEAARRREEADALAGQVQTLVAAAGRRQQALAARAKELAEAQARVAAAEQRLEALVREHLEKLERAAGLSREEARRQLVAEMTREARLEAAGLVKDARDEARRTATREAQKLILKAVQRMAAVTTIEHTVAAVPLASEDLKGRVIGREGRNIRAFEAATGVEVIVDDTPDAVLVSGFEPVRREIARLSLERLLADGRIHPARIEDVVERTRAEIEEEIMEAGEQAALELQIHGLHPELIRLVGRLKYRASFGQNLLAHSIEVAKLASLMAAELGLDARKARRAGLLHDIGKVVEEDLESPHAIVGMELCRRYKEHPDVANAVGAHHDEIPMATPIAPLVQAADAASGARPGARREAVERYVQRLQSLEALAASFEGVERVFAIQAGREIRVVVDTAKVSDALAEMLAAELSRRIEQELEYPGQIKVTVIREVRATAFAR
ncbi:MAG: ribonuclease Y [Rubricoccaceae bacterium]